MKRGRIYYLLEMLNFYSDTFARLYLTNLKQVGEIGATIISSIMDYKVVMLLIENSNSLPEMLANKGLSQEIISALNYDDDLIKYLWDVIDSPTIIKSDNLEANILNSVRRLDMGDIFLTVPLRSLTDHKEKRIGLVITAHPCKNCDPDIDVIFLEIIASFISGAFINCQVRIDLQNINETMILEIDKRKKLEEELKKRVKELEEFYNMAVGRELRMIELKEEINKLKENLSK